jgi:hypothetical protein
MLAAPPLDAAGRSKCCATGIDQPELYSRPQHHRRHRGLIVADGRFLTRQLSLCYTAQNLKKATTGTCCRASEWYGCFSASRPFYGTHRERCIRCKHCRPTPIMTPLSWPVNGKSQLAGFRWRPLTRSSSYLQLIPQPGWVHRCTGTVHEETG